MHESGIIHTSLHPADILVDRDGHCVIGNFETVFLSLEKVTAPHQVSNAVQPLLVYSGPELFSLTSTFDSSADFWSLGCTIFVLCCPEEMMNIDHRLREMSMADPANHYMECGLYPENMSLAMWLACASPELTDFVSMVCLITLLRLHHPNDGALFIQLCQLAPQDRLGYRQAQKIMKQHGWEYVITHHVFPLTNMPYLKQTGEGS